MTIYDLDRFFFLPKNLLHTHIVCGTLGVFNFFICIYLYSFASYHFLSSLFLSHILENLKCVLQNAVESTVEDKKKPEPVVRGSSTPLKVNFGNCIFATRLLCRDFIFVSYFYYLLTKIFFRYGRYRLKRFNTLNEYFSIYFLFKKIYVKSVVLDKTDDS